MPFIKRSYSLRSRCRPEGETSMSLRMRPDLESEIFTGLFEPTNIIAWNAISYSALFFSFTIMLS